MMAITARFNRRGRRGNSAFEPNASAAIKASPISTAGMSGGRDGVTQHNAGT